MNPVSWIIQMPPQIMLVLALFTFLAIALFRSKHERHFIVFMVRSSFGLRLIKWIAVKYRRHWEFLSDASVIVAFGGFGGWYLSSHGQTRNLRISVFAFLMLILPLSLALGDSYAAALAFSLFPISHLLLSRKVPALDFAVSSAVIALGYSLVFTPHFSIFMGMFGLPAVMLFVLLSHGMDILFARTDLPGISPMIPSSKDGNVGVAFPGYDIFIPWWHALFALFVTLVVHEGAHGIMVKCAGVKLKSTGLLTVFSVPIGAFVEPDEAELESKKSIRKMRVFSAGPFANFMVGVFAGIILVLATASAGNYLVSDGMAVLEVMDGYPAKGSIDEGAVIKSIDGIETGNWEQYNMAAKDLYPGQDVLVETSMGNASITLAARPDDPERGYLGVILSENIQLGPHSGPVSYPMLAFFSDSLFWIFFFNVNIGLVNLLPVVPFDGGRMFRELLLTFRMSQANVDRLIYAMVSMTLIMFLINTIPLFRMLYNLAVSLV